jgi:hypothetical protein
MEETMTPHIRIVTAPVSDEGAKRIVIDDRVLYVGEDGRETDISRICRGYEHVARYGEVRRLHLEVLAFEIVPGAHADAPRDEPLADSPVPSPPLPQSPREPAEARAPEAVEA